MPLGKIFTQKHVNVITIIMILMDKRDMKLLVQKPLLDPDDTYWKTGKYEYAELDLVGINQVLIVAAGRIQQVLVAALQILFDVGCNTTEGEDYSVLFYMNKKTTNIKVSLKFNKQDVHLAICEANDDSYMSLYIED